MLHLFGFFKDIYIIGTNNHSLFILPYVFQEDTHLFADGAESELFRTDIF